MKKTDNKNPLKFFNDKKDEAYKKAGGAMKNFKKSLPKAQYGPITENQSKIKELLNPQPPIPQAPIPNSYNSYNIDAANSMLIRTPSKSPYNRNTMEILERRTQINNRIREDAKKASGEKKKGGTIKTKKKK